LEFVLRILLAFVTIMQFAIIARAILSWFDRGMRNPISQILVQLTEPIIAPIRRFVPQAGMIDFSPLVALLILLVLRYMISAALIS
jgi:YggT family protein